MFPSVRCLWRVLFGISREQTTFARRGFHAADAAVRRHLERVGRTFARGYHAALAEDDPHRLAQQLNQYDLELRGFAFEGAAMGLALLDFLIPSRRRVRAFLDGPGSDHTYLVHVGVGWVLARLRRHVPRPPKDLDPLLRWLAVDGYGFHEGYFSWRRYVHGQPVPRRIRGYARRAFDQGLGRSLWFVNGADPARIAATISAFPQSRRGDLWSGVGLACAYAGGAGPAAVQSLAEAAAPFRPQLAQGAAFAAKARERAGNPAAHTELACRVLCGMPADAAAAVTDRALGGLSHGGALPAYEMWRRRIQSHFIGAAACPPSPGVPGEGGGEGPDRLKVEDPHPDPLPEYREREPEGTGVAPAHKRVGPANLCERMTV